MRFALIQRLEDTSTDVYKSVPMMPSKKPSSLILPMHKQSQVLRLSSVPSMLKKSRMEAPLAVDLVACSMTRK